MSSILTINKWPSLKKSSIAIRPFVTPGANMGLENYGMVLADGGAYMEELTILSEFGVDRAITGLNEFAPDVLNIADEDKKKAKITEIRENISYLEKSLASNDVDIKDKDFYKKLKLVRPDNIDFWRKMFILVGNEPSFLEPTKDPYDLIKLCAIEAGGFSTVAPSLEFAQNSNVNYKFYLDKLEDTVSTEIGPKMLKARAMAELMEMYDNNVDKLFYVLKNFDSDSAQYKKDTPNTILWKNAEKGINGELVEKDKKKCAQRFLDYSRMDLETLKSRAIVKDSIFYKLLVVKSDGFIYHTATSTVMGRNVDDCVAFVKNPLHADIIEALLDKINYYWSN